MSVVNSRASSGLGAIPALTALYSTAASKRLRLSSDGSRHL